MNNNRVHNYYHMPPPKSSNYHSNGYSASSWSNHTPATNHSPNWDRNSQNGWKQQNRNWNQNRYNAQPYSVPKKAFNNRYQQNRNGNNGSFYENSPKKNWPKKQQPQQPVQFDENDQETEIPGIIATKKRKKPMSKSYPSSKWDEKDAQKALATEKAFTKTLTNQSLIIKFPDPELGKETVKEFHPAIENVHFPQASTPRYCFAHLKEESNIDEVVAALEKIPFGQGFLSVELKKAREENLEVSPRDIDPYTLYVGNLPLNVTKAGVKQHFKDCTRLDIGHPQQMKNTRYAFVRFGTVDAAISAYKSTFNTLYDSRSMIVRFRRINGNVGIPGDTGKPPQPAKKAPESPLAKSPLDDSRSPPDPSSQIVTATSTLVNPDLPAIKEEPTSDNEDRDDYSSYDRKPPLLGNIPLGSRGPSSIYSTSTNFTNTTFSDSPIKTEYDRNGFFKKEPIVYKNEDEMEDEDEEDEFDARHDNFKYRPVIMEDEEEGEDYDDDEDYDVDDEDLSLELNGAANYLPGDDDDDLFQ